MTRADWILGTTCALIFAYFVAHIAVAYTKGLIP